MNKINKSNNKIKNSEANDKHHKQKEPDFLDEPITLALVLRGSAEDIQELKSYLSQSELQLVYKTVSYGHLYISSKKVD